MLTACSGSSATPASTPPSAPMGTSTSRTCATRSTRSPPARPCPRSSRMVRRWCGTSRPQRQRPNPLRFPQQIRPSCRMTLPGFEPEFVPWEGGEGASDAPRQGGARGRGHSSSRSASALALSTAIDSSYSRAISSDILMNLSRSSFTMPRKRLRFSSVRSLESSS